MNAKSTARVLVGYDGSPAAGTAIDAAARLLPAAHAWITHMWVPPFANEAMRRRLWTGNGTLNQFVAAIEREGAAEAGRLTAMGVALARAAGWDPEPLVERSYGGEGFQFGELAEKLDPDLAVVGSRGLGGARAVLGSVSDMIVHYTPRPVLVVPYPLLTPEWTALETGPVVVAWDSSPGAVRALDAADRLLPGRRVVLVAVHDGDTPPPAPPGRELVGSRLSGIHLVPSRAVAAALLAEANRLSAAAVVVGSRGRAVLPEILLGSVAMATLHHSPRPVLVVPAPSPTTPTDPSAEDR